MTNSFENPPLSKDLDIETVRGLAKASLNPLDSALEAGTAEPVSDQVEDAAEEKHEQLDADLDAFEETEAKWEDAKELVPAEVFTKENLDVIIGNMEKVLKTVEDPAKFAEAETGLDSLIDVRDRLENGGTPDLDAIFDNYNNLARGNKDANPDVMTESDVEFARRDLLNATEQMNTDIKAYEYLHVALQLDPTLLKQA